MGDVNFNIGGPRDQAKQQVHVKVNPVPSTDTNARLAGKGGEAALSPWLEKLLFLEEQEAIASSPRERFELQILIKDAKAKIQDLTERLQSGTGNGQ